jgi:hypothetical protein
MTGIIKYTIIWKAVMKQFFKILDNILTIWK